MVSSVQKTIHQEVLDVLYDYLGPASERFVEREVRSHLGKDPHDLTRDDIAKLHEWSKLAIALLADDPKTVDDFSDSLLSIAHKKRT